MPQHEIAGRRYPRVYRTSGRADVHQFLLDAVAATGGRVIYASAPTRAPVFVGLELNDERIGLLCYPFRATRNVIRNRPSDEHRLQIRYGAEATWKAQHLLGFDIAGVDTTLVLGVHIDAGIFLGLDPALYDPLPMGISIEFKDAEVRRAQARGWHSWERINRPGNRRSEARSRIGLETLVAFKAEPARTVHPVRARGNLAGTRSGAAAPCGEGGRTPNAAGDYTTRP